MPDFIIEDGKRFDGEFILKACPLHDVTPDEQNYVKALVRAMDRFDLDRKGDPTETDAGSTALRQARQERREQALRTLRCEANEFLNDQLAPETAADNVFTTRGRYRADLDKMAIALFLVEPEWRDGQVVDVLIRVAESAPISPDPAAQEKQSLYVALDGARTVVKTVTNRMEERAGAFWHKHRVREREVRRAQRVRNDYMRKLVDIGQLGLQHPHVDLGKLALNGFRAEFVAQEAGRVKNAYVRSLGSAAGVTALLAFIAFALAREPSGLLGFLSAYKVFFLAAGGAAIGTWLSFSIRRVTLSFEDLAMLEEDLLDPGLRVIFVVILTMVVCLLFWTGAVNLEIGNLKTGDLSNPVSKLPIEAIALLVGIFCGIAERALATAISGRASTFVRGVGA